MKILTTGQKLGRTVHDLVVIALCCMKIVAIRLAQKNLAGKSTLVCHVHIMIWLIM